MRIFLPALLVGALALSAPVAEPAEPTAQELLVAAKTEADTRVEPNLRLELVPAIVRAQVRAGDRASARAGAAQVGDLGWSALAEAYAEAGDVTAALDAAARIQGSAMERAIMDPREVVVLEVVRRSAHRGGLTGATRAAAGVKQPALAAAAQAALAEAHARAGDRRGAAASFRAAAFAAERARFTPPLGAGGSAIGYSEIGKVHARLGDHAAAAAAFDRAQAAAGRVGSETWRDGLLADIGAARAVAGDFPGAARALRAVDYLQDRRCLEAWVVLARSQAEAGQHEAAMQTAAAVPHDVTRAVAFAAVARVYAARGDRARTAQAFERAVQAAEVRPADRALGISYRDEALIRVVEAYGLAGDEEGGLDLVLRIGGRGGGPARELAGDELYDRLAQARASAGDPEAALAVIVQIRPGGTRVETWRAIGRAAGARDAVSRVLARGPADGYRRAMFLLGLAEGLLDRSTPGPAKP
jgi:tetratricopeptide (TPR) repeat protein